MSKPFAFKQFSIIQDVNPQKVGTDSMLLGAWVLKQNYNRVLDVGTGTGILALMMAQRFPQANITAIEPDLPSLQEAASNFKNSIFDRRIMPVNCSIQQFGAMEKFDLIISNPPYFESAYLSDDIDRNRARHTSDLPIHEFYEFTFDLLQEKGNLAIIIPFDLEDTHIERAEIEGFYPAEIMRTKRIDGEFKRSLIRYIKSESNPTTKELIVKDDNNNYSPEYIALTREFYAKDLSK